MGVVDERWGSFPKGDMGVMVSHFATEYDLSDVEDGVWWLLEWGW